MASGAMQKPALVSAGGIMLCTDWIIRAKSRQIECGLHRLLYPASHLYQAAESSLGIGAPRV